MTSATFAMATVVRALIVLVSFEEHQSTMSATSVMVQVAIVAASAVVMATRASTARACQRAHASTMLATFAAATVSLASKFHQNVIHACHASNQRRFARCSQATYFSANSESTKLAVDWLVNVSLSRLPSVVL